MRLPGKRRPAIVLTAVTTAWLTMIATPARAQTAGNYVLDGGSYKISIEVVPGLLTVVEPNRRSEYKQTTAGVFQYESPSSGKQYGIRVVNAATLEMFRPDDASAPVSKFRLTDPVTAEQKRALAETTTPEEMYQRGLTAMKGENAAPDAAEAARWYERASSAGHGKATLELGLMYRRGKGVARSYARSADLINRAAGMGVTAAYAEMAAAHVNGLGVKQDRAMALAWANKAVDAGDPWGHYQASYAYYVGGEDTRKSNYRMLLAADMGLAAAINRMKGWPDDWKKDAYKDRERAKNGENVEAGGGGFLRGVAGAAVGLAAAKAVGATDEQTVGAMAKGVELANPNSEGAKAIGAVGDQLLSGQLSASSPSGTGGVQGVTPAGTTANNTAPGKPSGIPGTWTLKPNQLTNDQACKGFTLDNYKTRAFDKNGDGQLYPMCGQAFDLYNSYINARNKGYSEADANRTWEAHAMAAKNASSYYKNNRSTGGFKLP